MSKVKVLIETPELVEVVMPEAGMANIKDGEFTINVGKEVVYRKAIYNDKNSPMKWYVSSDGKLVRAGKNAHCMPVLEIASNPFMDLETVARIKRHFKLDARKQMWDQGRVEVAKEIQRVIDVLRKKKCNQVFVAFRHSTFSVVIPADEPARGLTGVVVFTNVAIAGC